MFREDLAQSIRIYKNAFTWTFSLQGLQFPLLTSTNMDEDDYVLYWNEQHALTLISQFGRRTKCTAHKTPVEPTDEQEISWHHIFAYLADAGAIFRVKFPEPYFTIKRKMNPKYLAVQLIPPDFTRTIVQLETVSEENEYLVVVSFHVI
ncbi:hypothetical protein ACQKN7_27455 [Bacillus cereus]|uniref:hypothetical protein n=1 Tax=Bacillus cereus TaxID=1396 RepID=UPI003CFF3D64